MPSIFRDQMPIVFVDQDQHELGRIGDARFVPRMGENVRLRDVPYVVDRVGYDVKGNEIAGVFVVLVPT